jgi:hypothetical protein
LAAVPAAALTIVAILLIGAPLGRVLFPVKTLDFWPSALAAVDPKPTEQARYLIALGGAILVPLAIIANARWPLPRSRLGRPAALLVQLVFVLILAVGTLCHEGSLNLDLEYFTLPTILVALLIGAVCTLVISWRPAFSRARKLLLLDSRAVRWGAAAIALLATVAWVLPAIQLDGTVANAHPATTTDLVYTFDEGLSVLNGHTPLVNYVAQYGSLWPYVVAFPLHLTNGSLGGFTTSMAAITTVAMLAIYGVLRRVTRSAIGALALFLPFLATSFFLILGTPLVRYSFADYFGVFPLRYAGPYLVAFLIARHLSGAQPRRATWIFLAAGLALLNNGDFGVPALGATIIALVAGSSEPRTRRWSLRLAIETLGGLIAAYALLSIVTLARTGSLPNIGLLFRYAHLFALAGYNMLPTPWFGFWVVIYLTFAAALAVATTMAVRRSPDRVTLGMLAWIGIFGLGIGSYYGGRSNPQVLIAMFSAWSLCLSLLVVVTVRSIAQRPHTLGPAQIALFVGLGLTVCSLAQFPAPWRSIERLRSPAPIEALQPTADVAFVAAHSRPGETVALLATLGQRISREADVDDVLPYTGILSMPTREQLTETLENLREDHGTTLYVREGEAWPELIPAIERRGFRPVAATEPRSTTATPPPDRLVKFTDSR